MKDETVRPVIIISKCLGFDRCRYNGQTIPFPFLDALKQFVEFKPVCPEVEIGLGIPREPIRIVLDGEIPRLYQPATGKDVTSSMESFTNKFLDSLETVDGFILKNRSPSCGVNDVKIYTGFEKSARSVRGNGFFGGAVLDRYPDKALEDEGRLRNFTLRDHFLIKLFTFTRFRLVKHAGKMKDLIKFHSDHKYLLLAYNQKHYRLSGKIVANHQKHPVETVLHLYETELGHIFRTVPRYTAIINTLMHMFGYVSGHLSEEEKTFFLNSLEEYRDERIPLSTLIHLIHAYAIRFKSDYLLRQVFLNPFPRQLVEITDSGKGRNL